MASADRSTISASTRVLGYRGHQILHFVRQTIDSQGSAPSYSEICEELGVGSKGEVAEIVERLERRGLIRRVGKGRVRRLRLP